MTEYTADQQQTRAEAMAQYKCIADLLNAVQVDFEQLETLRDDRDSHDTDEHDGAS